MVPRRWTPRRRRRFGGVATARALLVATVAVGFVGAVLPATAGATVRPIELRAPRTSAAQEAHYLTDVAQADTDLIPYVNQYGNAALRGMLTDGLAFCAFLVRSGNIDGALVDVAVGARADEKRTHLPLSVHTFNTLEALALIDLCPREQRLVPVTVRQELQQLTVALRSRPSASVTSPSG